MSARAQVVVVLVALVALAGILWLVRRGSLKERFALIWLGIGAGLVAVVVLRPAVDRVSEWLGIESGTSLVFVAAILFLLALVLHLSILVSAQEEKTRDLAEALALLRADIDENSEPGAPVQPAHEGKHQPQVGGEDGVDDTEPAR
jgi:hypothetical protein